MKQLIVFILALAASKFSFSQTDKSYGPKDALSISSSDSAKLIPSGREVYSVTRTYNNLLNNELDTLIIEIGQFDTLHFYCTHYEPGSGLISSNFLPKFFYGTPLNVDSSGILKIDYAHTALISLAITPFGVTSDIIKIVRKPIVTAPVGQIAVQKSTVTAFPNPFSDKIKLNNSEIIMISIVGIDGKIISSHQVNPGGELDLSDLKKGSYYINDNINPLIRILKM